MEASLSRLLEAFLSDASGSQVAIGAVYQFRGGFAVA
jgi:hypothetical protein